MTADDCSIIGLSLSAVFVRMEMNGSLISTSELYSASVLVLFFPDL